MSRFNEIIKGISQKIGNIGQSTKRYVGIMPGYTPRNPSQWDGRDFLSANDISLYANKAVDKRAEKVGEVEFVLRDKNGDIIKNPNNKLLDLLYRPNKVFTGREFWKLYQKYLDLTGEAYIWIERGSSISDDPDKIYEKGVVGLHLLRSDLVKVVWKDGEMQTVKYKVDGVDEVAYEPKDIIYIHNPDPRNPLKGQSLLKAGITAIQTETQIASYHSNVLANGGKVEGVFKFKTGVLTKEQLKDIKEKYKKEYAGARKSGVPLFLGGDAEYIKTGLSPEELSYLEAKKMTLEDICILTSTPKAILSSFDDIQYSNAEASIKVFLRETVKPLLVKLTTALDEKLFPGDINLSFIDPTPEDSEKKTKRIEGGIKNHYMTINEARGLDDLEPVEGGDVIMVPFNLVELGSNPNASAEGAKKKL